MSPSQSAMSAQADILKPELHWPLARRESSRKRQIIEAKANPTQVFRSCRQVDVSQ